MFSLFSPPRMVALAVLAWPALAHAQGTLADYARSENFSTWTKDKVFRATVVPSWSEDGDRFWYKADVAKEEWEFVAVDAVKGARRLAFDHSRMAAALSKIHGRELS